MGFWYVVGHQLRSRFLGGYRALRQLQRGVVPTRGEDAEAKKAYPLFYPNVVFNVLTECVSSKSGCYLAAHQLSNHVGLAFMLTQVKHSDDVGMGAKPPHSLGLSGDAGVGDVV